MSLLNQNLQFIWNNSKSDKQIKEMYCELQIQLFPLYQGSDPNSAGSECFGRIQIRLGLSIKNSSNIELFFIRVFLTVGSGFGSFNPGSGFGSFPPGPGSDPNSTVSECSGRIQIRFSLNIINSSKIELFVIRVFFYCRINYWTPFQPAGLRIRIRFSKFGLIRNIKVLNPSKIDLFLQHLLTKVITRH